MKAGRFLLKSVFGGGKSVPCRKIDHARVRAKRRNSGLALLGFIAIVSLINELFP